MTYRPANVENRPENRIVVQMCCGRSRKAMFTEGTLEQTLEKISGIRDYIGLVAGFFSCLFLVCVCGGGDVCVCFCLCLCVCAYVPLSKTLLPQRGSQVAFREETCYDRVALYPAN